MVQYPDCSTRPVRWRALAAAAGAALFGVAMAAAIHAQSRSVWDGVFTDAQAERGEKGFQAQCASCHAAGKGASDATAPGLSGAEFTERWAGQPVGEIFQTMRTAMPPGAPSSLSREMYVDILAYLLKVNQYPAGSVELPPEVAKLGQITLDSKPK